MPRTCPSTGKACAEWVCNEGGWPCDPTMAQELRRAAPAQVPEPVVATDEGVTLAVQFEPEAPMFRIDE